jgi:hypothetical protein
MRGSVVSTLIAETVKLLAGSPPPLPPQEDSNRIVGTNSHKPVLRVNIVKHLHVASCQAQDLINSLYKCLKVNAYIEFDDRRELLISLINEEGRSVDFIYK